MNDIDRKIREALRAEDAELFAGLDSDQALLEMVRDSFRTKARWLIAVVFVVMAALMAVVILSLVQCFSAEDTRSQILWAICFMFASLGIMGMKVWYWMELNKNAITREIKRVELEISLLAKRIEERP